MNRNNCHHLIENARKTMTTKKLEPFLVVMPVFFYCGAVVRLFQFSRSFGDTKKKFITMKSDVKMVESKKRAQTKKKNMLNKLSISSLYQWLNKRLQL